MRLLRNNSLLLIILLAGFTLRVFVAVNASVYRDHPDIIRYKDWAKIAYLYGFADTYKKDHLTFGMTPNTMPPGSLYIIYGAYRVHLLAARVVLRVVPDSLQTQGFINGPLQNFIFRTPQMLADCITAFIIYLIIRKKYGRRQGEIGAFVYLFHPAVWYNSAFWGQMDGLVSLFLVLSLYAAGNRKIWMGILLYVSGLYVKLTAVMLLPVFFVFWSKIAGIGKTVLYLFTACIPLLLMTLFITTNPASWFIRFLNGNTTGEMRLITNHAFNFWWMVFRPFSQSGEPGDSFRFSSTIMKYTHSSSELFAGVPLFYWAMIIFLIFAGILIYRLVYSKRIETDVPTLLSLIALTGFLFLPHMHDRYLFPFYALFLIAWPLFRKYWYLFLIISLANVTNLYVFWHPIAFPLIPFGIWNTRNFQWYVSIILTLSSLYLYFKAIAKPINE